MAHRKFDDVATKHGGCLDMFGYIYGILWYTLPEGQSNIPVSVKSS